MLLAQHTLFDPSRAPAGQHTAWGYCHVPRRSDSRHAAAHRGANRALRARVPRPDHRAPRDAARRTRAAQPELRRRRHRGRACPTPGSWSRDPRCRITRPRCAGCISAPHRRRLAWGCMGCAATTRPAARSTRCCGTSNAGQGHSRAAVECRTMIPGSPNRAVPPASATRLVSVDAFRGATIALMVLVNTPGDGAHVYGPLQHADWHGWTPTDVVFPSFLWIVGLSLTLSFQRRLAAGATRADLFNRRAAPRGHPVCPGPVPLWVSAVRTLDVAHPRRAAADRHLLSRRRGDLADDRAARPDRVDGSACSPATGR